MFKSHFGTVLRKLRLQRGMTQENLASLSNMERTFISMLERGIKQPSLESICNLSQSFELRPHELLHLFEQEILRAGSQHPDDLDLLEDQRNLAKLEAEEDRDSINKIINTLPVAFFTRTPMPDYQPTFFSSNISKITGFDRAHFMGSSAPWFDRIHPDDRECVIEKLRVMRSEDLINLEYRFVTSDGKWLNIREDVRLSGNPSNAHAEVLGTLTGSYIQN